MTQRAVKPASLSVPEAATTGQVSDSALPQTVFIDLAFVDHALDPEDPNPKTLHHQGQVPADDVYDLIEKWGLK